MMPTDDANAVRVRISAQLLADVLALPDGAQIVDASYERSGRDLVVLVVSHPDLPPGRPYAEPIYRKARDGTVTLIDWGIVE